MIKSKRSPAPPDDYPKKAPTGPDYLTLAEVAARVAVSQKRLRQLTARNLLPVFASQGLLLFSEDDLERIRAVCRSEQNPRERAAA